MINSARVKSASVAVIFVRKYVADVGAENYVWMVSQSYQSHIEAITGGFRVNARPVPLLDSITMDISFQIPLTKTFMLKDLDRRKAAHCETKISADARRIHHALIPR